jgi:sulfite reductase beta subunit-like hemoprotein
MKGEMGLAVNHMEKIKNEKDGLDAIRDIYRYAGEGSESIPADEFDRFKWYGLYQQRPKDGHFMIRVNIPGGHYSSQQMKTMAAIARDYGRGFGDITTRQTYEFHWLTIHDVPNTLKRLNLAGLSTTGAGGDIMRNITGCPVAGRDRREIFDAQPDITRVSEYFLGNRKYSNLPRKFKLSICACGINCCFPQINCASFVGVCYPNGPHNPHDLPGPPDFHGPCGIDQEGYNLYLGGGLSREPRLTRPMDIFVRRDQVLETAVAVAEIFRDYGYRETRSRARLKFLVDDWGTERFREEIAKRLSFIPYPAARPLSLPSSSSSSSPYKPADGHHDHLGVFPQKESGLNYIGITVPKGRTSAEQMAALADIADAYGSGRMANTCHQNLIILDVPDGKLPAAISQIHSIGLTTEELSVKGDCVVCIGKEFCNLALTQTKSLMGEIISFLEQNLTWDQHININMNGCPNSCGHHLTADIGLQGTSARIGGITSESFDFFVCAGTGDGAMFSRRVSRKLAPDRVAAAIASLIRAYQATRQSGQTFRSWCSERSDEEIAGLLKG